MSTTQSTLRPFARTFSGLALAASLLFASCSEAPGGAPTTPEPEAGPEVASTDAETALEGEATPKMATSSGLDRNRLDTGIDLTSLGYTAPSAADPGAPAPALPEGAVPASPHAGLPGHISLVDGEQREVDLGKVKQGDKRTHTFRMLSDGDHDLVVNRFKSSCGCTVANSYLVDAEGVQTKYVEGTPIPPGTELQLEVETTTDGKPAGRLDTSVALYSNDVRGVFALKLIAEVETVLQLDPGQTINFDQITSADRVEGSVRVSSDSLDPFMLTIDERFVVPPFEVEVVPVEPTAEGKATVWDVNLALGPDIPEGVRNYPVLLSTDVPIPYPKQATTDGSVTPMYQTRIYAQATVKGMVSAQPPFLSFGMVRPGERLERTVRLECFDDFELGTDLPISLGGMRPGVDFPYAEHFSWSVEKTDSPKALDVILRLEGLPDDVNGSFGGTLTLAVGHPLKPEISIRFSGVCRQGLPEVNPVVGPPATPAPGGAGK